MKRFVYSLMLFVYFISCGKSSESKEEIASLIHIKVEKTNMSSLQPLRLSEFVDSVGYLQLEATSECFLPYYGTRHTLPVGNFLFLSNSQSILKFDATTGKFIGKIGNKGQGPEEYAQIQNICIDKDNSRIIVKDGSKQKLLTYNYKGDYLGQINFNDTEGSLFSTCFYTLTLKDIDSQYMIFIADIMTKEQACQPDEVIVYDYKNKKICHTSPNLMSGMYKRYSMQMSSGMRNSTRYDGKIYHKSFYNDTLYSIHKEKGINPFAIIDLGERELSSEFFLSKNPFSELSGKILINSIYMNSDCILIECNLHKDNTLNNIDYYICKYDINSGKSTYHQPYLINDIDGGSNAYSIDQLSTKMGYIFPSDELDGKDPKIYFSTLDQSELKYPELKERFELLQKNRNPDDNPLLMMLYVK